MKHNEEAKKSLRGTDWVVEKTGLSRTTIWRMEKAGTFPKRKMISPRRVAYLESDIDQWIVSLDECQ